jgi:hypothetical protein
MDTIAYSTMGNLVVGNYDLTPAVPGGVASGNGFICDMTRHRWTLLRLGGSLSSKTTLYAIWQDGGQGSPNYTLAGGTSAHGSSARGPQRGFLMNYSERTGKFGRPKYFTYFVPVSARTGAFGTARWFPVNVATSGLCLGGCSVVTANTVYQNRVMGLYVPKGSADLHTYLATVPGR